MAGIICHEGTQQLNSFIGAGLIASFKIRLFVNNHTPAYGDTVGSYTDASFGGYAEQAISGYTDEGVSGDIDTASLGSYTFTPTGSGLPVTVYGYWITDGDLLIGAELFPSPIVLSVVGIGITVQARISYQDRSVA